MATNEILRFAETDTGTNLLTQAEYLADSQRPIGNQPGVARSKLVNKALRQASLIAAGLAEYIADNQANNITDALTPQNIADYLQAAITGALGVTPPQFDNDTSLATTAFVQRALGNRRSYSAPAVGVIAASEAGKAIGLASAGTYTLPAAADVPFGAAFEFFSTTSGAVIQREGSDAIILNGASTPTSVALNNGDTLVLVKAGVTSWIAVSGSAQLGKSAAFGSSITTSGYQKLPSGLIIQWGSWAAGGTSGLPQVVTFPITFPNNVLSVACMPGSIASDANQQNSSWTDTITPTGFNGHAIVPLSITRYIAIGY